MTLDLWLVKFEPTLGIEIIKKKERNKQKPQIAKKFQAFAEPFWDIPPNQRLYNHNPLL